ncbi:DUF927 domain-containing protein [Vreelandella sp. EE22]
MFGTSSWTAGQAGKQHLFTGQLSTSPIFQENGSLQDWRNQVGKLCGGNSLATFAIGKALALPC